MTGSFNKRRFGFASKTTTEQLNSNSINPKSVKSTAFWLNVRKGDAESKRSTINNIEENEPERLKKVIETLFAEVKNKNGED